MKLEEVLPYLRLGATIGTHPERTIDNSVCAVNILMPELLGNKWEILAIPDAMLIEKWERDAEVYDKTGQPAQVALLRQCIKQLKTRRL